MTIELITALVVFSFVSSITPGPNNLMLLASGMNFGFKRTLPHALGVALGFILMLILVGLGLAQAFEQFPPLNIVLKVVSVVFLLYLAFKIATTSTAPSAKMDEMDKNAHPMTFLQAAAFQWVNPKAWAMALTAMTAYTPEDRPFMAILIIAFVFGSINFPSVATWVFAGQQLRRFLNDPKMRRIFNIVCAVLLVASLYPVLFPNL